MKKFLIFVIGIILFIPFNVKAYAPYSPENFDSCVNDGTCILLCGYSNSFNFMKNGAHNTTSLYIYYRTDTRKSWQVSWYGLKEITKTFTSIAGHQQDVFFQPSITTKLSEKGICPSYGYIDQASLGWTTEACFDSDGNYCTEKDPGGMGTDFKGTGSTSELVYNYVDNITYFVNTYNTSTISCSDALDESKTDEILTNINKNLEASLFNGKAIPAFVQKNPTYIESIEQLASKIAERTGDCYEREIRQIGQKQLNGKLSDEEAKKQIDELSESYKQVTNNLNDSFASITGNSSLIEGTIEISSAEGCGIISADLREWLNQLLNMVKIAAVVLTTILGMLDFLKGTASGEADAMKKVWKNFSNRLIAVFLLFLIPIIINFILNIATIPGLEGISDPLCGLK